MSLLDTLTGGENQNAKDALNRAQELFGGIQTPNAAQLTLPELQQYVQAGIMTPAEAQAALQNGNAFDDVKVDPSSMSAEQKALGEMSQVAGDSGMTPAMKAQLTTALDAADTHAHGANAAITDQFAQRGIPTSLMAEANMRAEAGDDARTANLTATQAAGQAEQNAINAMMNEGSLASTIHGQNYSEQAQKAAAENAMREWNAGATNATSEANANRTQQASAYNQETKQNVANQNTGLKNQRSEYNANVPQTVFNDQMAKAGGQAGIYKQQADQSTAAGNQMLGLVGAGVGAAGNIFAPAPVAAAHGAVVPGEPVVPGDSPQNDNVHALLSPGEVVIPRSVAPHPEAVKRFVQSLIHQKEPVQPAHPDDVHSVLQALTKRREQPAEPFPVGSSRG